MMAQHLLNVLCLLGFVCQLPVKIVTDIEDGRALEDGTLGSVCIVVSPYHTLCCGLTVRRILISVHITLNVVVLC